MAKLSWRVSFRLFVVKLLLNACFVNGFCYLPNHRLFCDNILLSTCSQYAHRHSIITIMILYHSLPVMVVRPWCNYDAVGIIAISLWLWSVVFSVNKCLWLYLRFIRKYRSLSFYTISLLFPYTLHVLLLWGVIRCVTMAHLMLIWLEPHSLLMHLLHYLITS